MQVTGKRSIVRFGMLMAVAFLPHGFTGAQDKAPVYLGMNQAVDAALQHNASLKESNLEQGIATNNYRQTNAVMLPTVVAGFSAISTNNPLNVFGSKLQQAAVTAADFNPTLLNDPDHREDFSAAIELQQPLLNMDMLYRRAAARKQVEMYDYKARRTKEYVRFNTQKSYMDLQLAYQSVAVLEESLHKVQWMEDISRRFFEQGLIKKTDLLNVQVNVATVQSHLSRARNGVSTASETLALVMGEPTALLFRTDSLVLNENENQALGRVSETRADLMAMKKAVEAGQLMEKSEQMTLMPRINAFASYQTNDSKFGQFDAKSYLAGVKLSWTLFDGTRSYHAIRARKTEREKMEVQLKQQQDQSVLELNKAIRDKADFVSEINRRQLAVEQAEESLRISQNRYREGLVSTTDLLLAQTQLLQQQLQLAQAVYGSNLTKAYIEFLGAH